MENEVIAFIVSKKARAHDGWIFLLSDNYFVPDVIEMCFVLRNVIVSIIESKMFFYGFC